MDKTLSTMHKEINMLLKKEETFEEAIQTLLSFRSMLLANASELLTKLSAIEIAFCPLPKAKGYESKTVAYSLYHAYVIEDIVANILIANRSACINSYQAKLNIPYITTGNELKEELVSFSKCINPKELLNYLNCVTDTTNALIRSFTFKDLKRRFNDHNRSRLVESNYIHVEASWLIDYWVNKNISGLLLMPFSRHLLMHIEAANRICNKIKSK